MSLDVHPVLDSLAEQRRNTDSMHAATMTLAIFIEDAPIAAWVYERTRIVAEKYPARVLMLDGARPEGEAHAEQSASRGEWVELGVQGSTPDNLTAAVAALALAEAPLVLVWLGRHISNDERFAQLKAKARTTIVSSSAVDLGPDVLRDLIRFYDEHTGTIVHDVAYLRLSPWREVVAEFFDDPDLARELSVLRHVEIIAGSDAEMYYVLGWLASRLGWAPCDEGRFCNSEGGDVTFALRREGEPRRVRGIHLQSKETTFRADVLEDDPNAVCVEVTGEKHRDRRCSPLHDLDIATLIERALLGDYRENIFREALTMAREIIDRKKG